MRFVRLFAVFGIAIPASILQAASSCAESKSRRTDPLTTIWNTKLHAEPGPVPDFVQQSRPAGEQGYLPLTAPQPKPQTTRKSADELKAMEAELDFAADANRRRAGRSSAVAAGPGKTSPKLSTVGSGAAAPIY